MEREALAVQQGSFSFAICLLVLGLGGNDPTWAQDEPVGPPAEQATEKKPNKAPAGRNSIATLDKVYLSDGSIQHGRVAELGGNTISLKYRGAAKRIPKALVDKIVFYEGRRSQQKLDTDLVILKVNEHRVPCKILKESGVEVRVALASGAKTTYRRDQVLRLHYRNEVLSSSSDYYTADLAQEMDKAIRFIVNGEEGRSAQAEKFLVQCGVFALGKVQRSLGSFKAAGEPEKKKIQSSFARILHIHQLKKVVTDSMETWEPRIYEELTYGGLEARESLLKVLYPKFTDESVPLAKYIISNEQEDVRLRALSVEILRRLNCNKALLEIYNDSSRELKLVSSVALVRNRIFFPIPTLLEALDVGGEGNFKMRALAAGVLRDSTRQNFGFKAEGTPEARAKAIAKWRQWWEENTQQYRARSLLVLNNRAIETDARKESREFWLKAHQFWTAGRFDRAGTYLREARRKDPSFLKAHVSYATLLYSELSQVEEIAERKAAMIAEAGQILKGLVDSALPEAAEQDLHWVHFEYGNVLRLQGKHKEALRQYENSLGLDPSSIASVLGIADSHWAVATGRNELSKVERKLEMQSALEGYSLAEKKIAESMGNIQVMSAGDIPQFDTLPFERRAHNRNALAVREELEEKGIRLSIKKARVYRLQEDPKKAVVALRQGLETLNASAEVKDKKAIEADLRAMLGVVYESMGQEVLAVKEYLKVVKDLDRTNQVCRRGYERLRKRLQKKQATASRG
jgi:tetratricopeptide (TPR) repeat protein